MSAVVGLIPLARLVVRRDRWLIPIFITLPALIMGTTAIAFGDLYPTAASRDQFATLMSANPGITAFLGPLHGSSIGAFTFWRTAILAVVLAGLVPMFTVIRHTRADEQAGRRELLGSTVVGRHAPLAAALVVTAGYSVLIGVGIAVALTAAGLALAGSVASGAAWTGLAFLCAGFGALAAQLVENPRTARGLCGGLLATAYAVRIVGDSTTGAIAVVGWVSPVAWLHAVRPYTGEQWLILAVFATTAGVATIMAFALSARRDLATGIIPTRLGPPTGDPRLGNASALARRIHRPAFFGWLIGISLYGLIIGALAPGMADLLEDNPQLKEIFDRIGGEGTFIDIFIAAGLAFIGIIAAAYALQAALRIRGEEQVGHAEVVLATPVTRRRFMASHAVLVAAGPALAVLGAGLVAGVAYGAVTDDLGTQVPRLVGAAAVHIPSVLVVGGLGLALFGAAPQATSLGWAALVVFLLIGQLGPILGLPQWAMNLSPFSHTPGLPGERLSIGPLIGLSAVAMAFAALGFAAFKRRDAAIG